MDVEHRPPLRGLSGEQGRGFANEYAVLRVTLRAAENAVSSLLTRTRIAGTPYNLQFLTPNAAQPRNAGKFSGLKKVGDPIMSVQLMKSQHGDSDDPVSLLDGAEEVRARCSQVAR